MQRAIHIHPLRRSPPGFGALARGARGVVGGFYLFAAVLNAVLTARDFTAYRAFATDSWLPGYGEAWDHLAVPALPALLVLLVVIEATLGVLILASGREARLGLVAASVFAAALIPANPQALVNIPLVVVQLLLARGTYERPVLQDLRSLLLR